MADAVSITESIHVARSLDAVWDYTQDYSRRREWDDSIIEAGEMPESSPRRVRIRARGGLSCVFEYKVNDRPRRTSLSMVDLRSPLIAAGGGSWQYEARDGGCDWTQVAGLTLKEKWWASLLRPLVAMALRRQMRRAMRRAKRILESA